MAKVDMFLKIDGIQGESLDSKHANEIELESFSFGAMNSGSFGKTSGGGSGKVSMQDFTFSQLVQKSTPLLLKHLAVGTHIANATLTVRKAGGGNVPGQEYLKVKFSDLLVSHYQISGNENDVLPHDSISLNFAKIHFEYCPQKKDGTLDGAIIATFDLKLNLAS